jgi:hypothetical protein
LLLPKLTKIFTVFNMFLGYNSMTMLKRVMAYPKYLQW